MSRLRFLLPIFILATAFAQTAEPPTSWIDPDTGHRIVRLTREPGSASLYFNQNGYTPNGTRLVYTTPDGISVLDLKTHEPKQVVKGTVRLVDAGRKNERVYYLRDGAAWWTDIDSGESHRIAALPARGSISTVNADETLLAGTYIEGTEGKDFGASASPAAATQAHPLDQAPNKGQMMEDRLAAHLPMGMYHHEHQDRRNQNHSPLQRLAESSLVFTYRSRPDPVLP